MAKACFLLAVVVILVNLQGQKDVVVGVERNNPFHTNKYARRGHKRNDLPRENPMDHRSRDNRRRRDGKMNKRWKDENEDDDDYYQSERRNRVRRSPSRKHRTPTIADPRFRRRAEDAQRRRRHRREAGDGEGPKRRPGNESKKGGKRPKNNQDGKRPKHNQDGKWPKHTKDGKWPKHNKDGKRPKHNKDGKRPKHNKDGKRPKHNSNMEEEEEKRPRKQDPDKDRKRNKMEESIKKKGEKEKKNGKTIKNKKYKKDEKERNNKGEDESDEIDATQNKSPVGPSMKQGSDEKRKKLKRMRVKLGKANAKITGLCQGMMHISPSPDGNSAMFYGTDLRKERGIAKGSCKMTIIAPKRSKLIVKCPQFSLHKTGCDVESLLLVDKGKKKKKNQFCKNSGPKNWKSSGNKIVVQFDREKNKMCGLNFICQVSIKKTQPEKRLGVKSDCGKTIKLEKGESAVVHSSNKRGKYSCTIDIRSDPGTLLNISCPMTSLFGESYCQHSLRIDSKHTYVAEHICDQYKLSGKSLMNTQNHLVTFEYEREEKVKAKTCWGGFVCRVEVVGKVV